MPFSCVGQAPFWHRSLVRDGCWMPAIVFFSSFRSIGSLASPEEKCAKPIGAGSKELFMQGIILCSYSLAAPFPPLSLHSSDPLIAKSTQKWQSAVLSCSCQTQIRRGSPAFILIHAALGEVAWRKENPKFSAVQKPEFII